MKGIRFQNLREQKVVTRTEKALCRAGHLAFKKDLTDQERIVVLKMISQRIYLHAVKLGWMKYPDARMEKLLELIGKPK
jgi:hypothetical protein